MWKDYIQKLKEKYIGKIVPYKNAFYNIVDVDYNGIIHIDKPTEYNNTSAVFFPYEVDIMMIKGEGR